jgi:hypothetical protein
MATKEWYQANKVKVIAKSKARYEANKEKALAKSKQRRLDNPEKWKVYRQTWANKHPLSATLSNCRQRAKAENIPCTITLHYLESLSIPEYCPILGIKLNTGKHEHKMSLDKIIPELGYVDGNIVFMSLRANRLKNDATLEELQAIVKFLEKNQV